MAKYDVEVNVEVNLEVNMNEDTLLWELLFGSIGLGFFIYGKKQKKMVPLGCGVLLMIMPYFMPNLTALVIVAVILLAVLNFGAYICPKIENGYVILMVVPFLIKR